VTLAHKGAYRRSFLCGCGYILGCEPSLDFCITPFQHEIRAAPAGRAGRRSPVLPPGKVLLAWRLDYAEVFSQT
jgi:hypothetical protein